MLFERLEDKGLSQFSYIVGCEGAGEVAVIDPRRDVDVYLDFARTRRLRITRVLETHIHADFASGAVELAAAAGAELAVSAYDRGELYETQFPHRALTHGETIDVGRVRLQALHTPGHTPEHLSFLVFDGARSSSYPMVLLSGDFLFVGSLGRPDLLGEESKRALAAKLYRSVRDVLGPLPDGLEIAPGHGAGSMCGAGMSGRASSTLGFERIANPYLQPGLSEEQFIERILSHVPPFPAYYRRMKALNARGAAILGGLPGLHADGASSGAGESGAPQPMTIARFEQAVRDGHVVIDLRDQVSFGAGHVPGSFGIGSGTNLSTWASWVVPYDQPIVLVSAQGDDVEGAIRALVRVGLDDVRGFIAGGVDGWIANGHAVETTPQVSPTELAQRLGLVNGHVPRREREPGLHLVDVRSDEEWRDGHVAGAMHIMAGDVADRLADIPTDGTLIVICGSGYRSTVIASVLERAGRPRAASVTGGMTAWTAAGLPVVHD